MTRSIPSVSLAINSQPGKVSPPKRETDAIPSQLGLASIVGRIYGGADPDGLMQEIVARLNDPAQAAGAWLDLSILRRTLGDIENAEIFQTEALNRSRIFRQPSLRAR